MSGLRATVTGNIVTANTGINTTLCLGLVRTNKETGLVEKTNDMDYDDYINIINRVRKTKEFTRVRTEQARLASMYAQVSIRPQAKSLFRPMMMMIVIMVIIIIGMLVIMVVVVVIYIMLLEVMIIIISY